MSITLAVKTPNKEGFAQLIRAIADVIEKSKNDTIDISMQINFANKDC